MSSARLFQQVQKRMKLSVQVCNDIHRIEEEKTPLSLPFSLSLARSFSSFTGDFEKLASLTGPHWTWTGLDWPVHSNYINRLKSHY